MVYIVLYIIIYKLNQQQRLRSLLVGPLLEEFFHRCIGDRHSLRLGDDLPDDHLAAFGFAMLLLVLIKLLQQLIILQLQLHYKLVGFLQLRDQVLLIIKPVVVLLQLLLHDVLGLS